MKYVEFPPAEIELCHRFQISLQEEIEGVDIRHTICVCVASEDCENERSP